MSNGVSSYAVRSGSVFRFSKIPAFLGPFLSDFDKILAPITLILARKKKEEKNKKKEKKEKKKKKKECPDLPTPPPPTTPSL